MQPQFDQELYPASYLELRTVRVNYKATEADGGARQHRKPLVPFLFNSAGRHFPSQVFLSPHTMVPQPPKRIALDRAKVEAAFNETRLEGSKPENLPKYVRLILV